MSHVNVRKLKRRLLVVSGGVAVVVGVAGYFVWQKLRETARLVLVAHTTGVGGEEERQDEGGRVVVKRVLVRRRKDAGPDELGEVIEEHSLGSRPLSAMKETKGEENKAAGSSLRDRAKQLSMPQKIAVFGSLVAAFVGLNAWAIPKMKRTLARSSSGSGGVYFPPDLLAQVGEKRLFVDLACGEGLRLVEAASVFENVIGYESNGVTSWKARKLCASLPNVRVVLSKKSEAADADIAEADLVFCNTTPLADRALPLLKKGANLLTSEELTEAQEIWSGSSERLYRKD